MVAMSAGTFSSTYQWAFANIPADRLILQFLVNNFCSDWLEKNDADNNALNDLPQAFTVRVLRRYSQLVKMSEEERSKTNCYREHSSKAEQENCPTGLHMEWDASREFGDFLEGADVRT